MDSNNTTQEDEVTLEFGISLQRNAIPSYASAKPFSDAYSVYPLQHGVSLHNGPSNPPNVDDLPPKLEHSLQGSLLSDFIISEDEVYDMEFISEEEARNWFNTYAKQVGFSTRRDNAKYFDDGSIKSRNFVCNRQGMRSRKYLDKPDRKREHRNDFRCGCLARFRIARKSLLHMFHVTYFNPVHNHVHSDAQCTRNLQSHRKVGDGVVDFFRSLKGAGMSTAQSYDCMVTQAGGYGAMDYQVKDIYNKMQEVERAEANECDAAMALAYIDSLKKSHVDIFRSYDLDEENRLTSLFWCDKRSQIDYRRFGHVLVFDTTYRTNIYRKPLVILSGVNNHFQTTVFACAILNDEKTETYEWVLKNLMEAMHNKHPVSVITDGDMAMRNAIHKIFPNATHRLCQWHLFRNAQANMKLGKEFLIDFNRCLTKRSSVEQWEEYWKTMVIKYDIADKKWMQDAYSVRHMWAETFLKYHFFAGQRTTQRCESINKFFKQFIRPRMQLQALCKAFVKGLEKLRENERKQHSITDQSMPVVSTMYKHLEAHAARVYTRLIFQRFKKQAVKASNYRLIASMDDVLVDSIVYHLQSSTNTGSCPVVICSADNTMLQCTCCRFESEHLICRHIIFVLHHRGIGQIPDKLIDDTWRRTNSEFYMYDPAMREPGFRPGDDVDLRACRRGLMKGRLDHMNSLACTTEERRAYMNKWIDEGTKIMEQMDGEKMGNQSVGENGGSAYSLVRNPKPDGTKPKGSSKNTVRNCTRCKEPGHNRTTCPLNTDNDASNTQPTATSDTIDYALSQSVNISNGNQGGSYTPGSSYFGDCQL